MRLRLVRVEHGRKLLEVAKQDILPGGAATQRHVGGQQAMELVAMKEPPAGELEGLEFAVRGTACEAEARAGR